MISYAKDIVQYVNMSFPFKYNGNDFYIYDVDDEIYYVIDANSKYIVFDVDPNDHKKQIASNKCNFYELADKSFSKFVILINHVNGEIKYDKVELFHDADLEYIREFFK